MTSKQGNKIMPDNYTMTCTNDNNLSKAYGIEKFEGTFEKEEIGVTLIPNATINDIKNPAALGLYVYLLARPKNWKLNAKQLCAHFECSKDKLYRLLNYLIEQKLISCTMTRNKGKFTKPHYFVHLHKPCQPSYEPQSHSELSPYPEKPDTVKPDTENQDAYKTKNIKNKEKEKTSISPCGDGRASFSDFWEIYPIKKGRKKCEEKWRRLKLDEQAPVIIAKLKAQIEHDDQWKRGFVPNPLTYINGSLWEDEISTAPRNDAGQNRKDSDFNDFIGGKNT